MPFPYDRITLPAWSTAKSRTEFVDQFVKSYQYYASDEYGNLGHVGCLLNDESKRRKANAYFDKINAAGAKLGIDNDPESISLKEYQNVYRQAKHIKNKKADPFDADKAFVVKEDWFKK